MTNFEILQEYEKAGVPLPSFKELQDMKEYLDYCIKNRDQLTKQINFWMDKSDKLEKENARLRELLKECQKYFEQENQHSFTSCFEIKYELLTKIERYLDDI